MVPSLCAVDTHIHKVSLGRYVRVTSLSSSGSLVFGPCIIGVPLKRMYNSPLLQRDDFDLMES